MNDVEEESGLVQKIKKEKKFITQLKRASVIELNYYWRLKSSSGVTRVYINVDCCNGHDLLYHYETFGAGEKEEENEAGLQRSLYIGNPGKARAILVQKATEIRKFLADFLSPRYKRKRRHYYGYYLKNSQEQRYFGELLKRGGE